jgi:GAF domain-containing protein
MTNVQSSPATERRRHPRCRLVDTKIVPVDLGRDRRGLLVDLSLTGASVHPYGILQPGETSVMQLSLPDSGTRFEATGVVTWVNAAGRVGIEFMNVPSPARKNLNAWIECASAASSGLPTQATSQVAAAYLPSSYSPWIKMSDVLKDCVSGELEKDLARCDVVSALRLLLDRARSLTRASGAAIAIADGSDVVCRARSGVAPDLGARFKPDTGLSGEAVRTGATVLCSDTSDDPRVDCVACQHLNVRSVLIEPILSGNVVIGVIEVFSPSPQSFNETDTAHLKRLAELIAAMLDSNVEANPRSRRTQ